MRIARYIVLTAVLGLYSPVVSAFQETKASDQDKAAQSGVVTSGTGAGLNVPVPAGTTGGKELTLPGIGVLPKLDFGLELLYGTNATPNGPIDDKQDSGAQIRGTLKYRFPN